jgi:hypothetical protein
MSKILYFDCFSGASGDMILGALLDAGLPLDELRSALGSLALGDVTLETERVDRSGIGATKFRVGISSHDHKHGTDHHHHHRGLSEICAMVDRSDLSGAAKDRAKSLFRRLAETEAVIHQKPIEDIHLHEVGAVDSIIDIAGAVFGLEWFGAQCIVASALNVGSGTVKCAHGLLPVPAPATTRLLTGVPVYSSGIEAELLTPTGALVVTDYADRYGAMPLLTVKHVGYGAGERDLPGTPNVLRIVIGEDAAPNRFQQVVVIETEIDDMNPQIFGALMDQLYAADALDVFYVPIQMKKNRPGTLVSIVALLEDREALADVLFRETTTLGIRFKEMDREQLDREQITVETPMGAVRFKIASRDGVVVNAAPEFDDCAQLAEKKGVPIKLVHAMATKAYLDQ